MGLGYLDNLFGKKYIVPHLAKHTEKVRWVKDVNIKNKIMQILE